MGVAPGGEGEGISLMLEQHMTRLPTTILKMKKLRSRLGAPAPFTRSGAVPVTVKA